MEKHLLWWVKQIILTKNIFLAQFKIVQIFTIFVRSAPVDIPSKIQFSKKLRKIVEKHFLWWVEQIILTKNIFFAQFKIVQIFTIFVRSAPVDIPSKIQFSKNCLKIWRTLPLMSGTNNFDKNIFLAQFKIVQIFTIFVRSPPVDIPSKIKFSKNCLKLWRNTYFDEWNK